jgi:hypothetical protein
MSLYLITYKNNVYMQDASSYDNALDLLAEDLQVNRDVLVLTSPDLEKKRRELEISLIN